MLGARLAVVVLALVVAGVVSLGSSRARTGWDRNLTGTAKADVLRGSKGPDLIRGLAGPDRLFGYRGNDLLQGGSGNDLLVGGPGRDRLTGGPGNDRILARDGVRDSISCGTGNDTVVLDDEDALARDCPPRTVPPVQSGETVTLVDEPWSCTGNVNLDLVKVTMRTTVSDAVLLDRNCTGRVGRVEVETWTADGIKVQNRGNVAHDLRIESGYVKCHDAAPAAHQDGIQAMGGYRLLFRNLRIDCLRNANLYLSKGGGGASTPTDIVCERCVLGPNSGQTVFYNESLRSGIRRSTICTGRFQAIRIGKLAQAIVNVGNRVLPHDDPACANVTGLPPSP